VLWPENTPESAVVFATLHDRTRPLARETFELETLGMTAWERRAILRRIRQALASHEVAAAISAQQERERQRRGKRG
jgi:hypothetical protein